MLGLPNWLLEAATSSDPIVHSLPWRCLLASPFPSTRKATLDLLVTRDVKLSFAVDVGNFIYSTTGSIAQPSLPEALRSISSVVHLLNQLFRSGHRWGMFRAVPLTVTVGCCLARTVGKGFRGERF